MVLAGQFLERATIIRNGDLALEGLWHRGERAPAVLLLSPLPGQGSMDAPALNELAFALSRAGHPTLRFNYSGVGASPKAPRARRLPEARAAARVLRQSAGFASLVVVAFRSGAATALEVEPSAKALVLISPPESLDLSRAVLSPSPVLFILGQADPQRARLANHCLQTGDRLQVIENADIPFNRGLPQLAQAVVEYLQELGG